MKNIDVRPLPQGFPNEAKIDLVTMRNLVHERNELKKRVEALEAAGKLALAHLQVCNDCEALSAEIGAEAMQALAEALKPDNTAADGITSL